MHNREKMVNKMRFSFGVLFFCCCLGSTVAFRNHLVTDVKMEDRIEEKSLYAQHSKLQQQQEQQQQRRVPASQFAVQVIRSSSYVPLM